MKRRSLSIILTLAMLLSMLPAAVFAEGPAVVTDEESLEAALLAGGDIELANDIELSTPDAERVNAAAVIKADTTVVLDLKGYDITVTGKRSSNSESTLYAIDNYGTFTLKDTVGGGVITARGIENLGSGVMLVKSGKIVSCDKNGGAAIWNEADLTIDGGVFEAPYAGSINDSSGPGCLSNQSGATADINGGEFISVSNRVYAINSYGEITLDNAEITASGAHGCLAIADGTAVIGSGSYSATKHYAVYATGDAEVEINGGDFTGGQYGDVCIENTDATVAIAGGTFHHSTLFYLFGGATQEQGIVTGGTFADDPTDYLANGYEVTQDGGSWIVNEIAPEASINGTTYPTLAEAIANANGKTVVLEKDVTLSNVGITIPAGVTMTLDLNGKTLSGVSNVAGTTAVITNDGTLTIVDSGEGGLITTEALNYDDGEIPGYANNTITNKGTLTVQSGTVENGTAAGGAACYAIDNNSTVRDTKLTVEGTAKVVSKNRVAIRAFQNNTTKKNEIIVTGGEISGGKLGDTRGLAIWMQQSGANSIGSLTISGGDLYGRNNTVVVDADRNGSTTVTITGGTFSNQNSGMNLLYIEHFSNATSTGDATVTMTISGGEFTTADTTTPIAAADLGTITITGGTYNMAPADEFVAETHKIVSYNNGADVYKAVPADVVAYNVDKDVAYTTLAAAVAAVSDDECIVALEDISESVSVKRAVSFTLDENGKSVSSITAGSGYKVSVSEGVYTFTKKTSSNPTPTPTPTPDPTPTVPEVPEVEQPDITEPEAPKVDTTPDTSSPTVNEEVKENTDGTTTKTETKEDGTKVETTTGTDGSSTTTASKTETKENADGSTTTSTATNTSTTTAAGDKVTEEKVEEVVKTETSTTTTTATKTETETATGDKVTQEKVEAKVENADGSATTTTSTKTETTTAAGEKVTEEKKEEVKANTDGSVATTTSTKTETTTATGDKVTEQKVEEKVENTDGSATTTTTTVTQSENKTETTKAVEKVTVDENGEQTVTTQSQTDTALSNGSTGTTTVSEDGSVKAEVTVTTAAVAQTAKDETVALPMPEIPASSQTETAAVVEVKIPAAAVVEIPVEDVSAGAVAVIVHADGTEELVKDSYVTENGVAVGVEGDAVIKIVDNSKEFDDVSEGQWFHDAADFMSARGLMSGTAEGRFSPDQDSSRAMVWTMMASLNNAETTGGATWFEKSQDWAKENGISDGTDPDGSIAREQLAVMLWRQAGSPASGRSFADFNDADSISGWAEEAMRWALENGIMGGKGNGILDPKGNASRGEVAQMFKNFVRYTAHN